MANPTTNLNITLPVPGASRGVWGTTLNDALQSLDTGIADRGVPNGGTDDQILTKNGTTDYATEWATRLSSVGITGTDGIEVDSGSPVTTSGSIILGLHKASTLAFLNAEDGATADQTGPQIKTLYEAETSAFTDAQFTKLAGIETDATADQTGSQIKTLYQAESNAFTDAQFTKLAGIATSATADQTVTATGDATGSGTTTLALTLASSGVSAGTYGSTTTVPILVVDSKGRITSASTAPISGQNAAQVTAEATAQAISMSIALG